MLAKARAIAAVSLTLLSFSACMKSRDDPHAREMAERVKSELQHAWNNYERYAWGHDALKPLSKAPHDWYGQSLLMTPVDALDTLILMKLDSEAAKARNLIVGELSFDRDISVKNFEITIRLLGGLLSGYQLTGDKRLLDLADDLGTRLLPAFNSPTGLPYVFVNLRTGEVRNPISNPAETGTLLLEFGNLPIERRRDFFLRDRAGTGGPVARDVFRTPFDRFNQRSAFTRALGRQPHLRQRGTQAGVRVPCSVRRRESSLARLRAGSPAAGARGTPMARAQA